MYRHTKAGLAVLLSGAMLFGSASSALASETAVLQGPGAAVEASAQEPEESSGSPVHDASRNQEQEDLSKTTGPGAIKTPSAGGPSSGPGQGSDPAASSGPAQETPAPSGESSPSSESAPSETPQTEEGTQQGGELTEEQGAQLEAEQAAAEQEAQEEQDNNPLTVPKRAPRLQTTALLLSGQTWSNPFVNDQTAESDGLGFSSLSTFLESIHGDVLYRTYSTANGWSDWALNGQQTAGGATWVPVEAIQYRFKGPVADQYDIYYCAMLSDGTQTGWAKNGQTAGTMNQGLYMTGFRLAWYPKGAETGLSMENPVKAAHADGIQVVDGVLRYIHGGDGSNFTGWGWSGNDRYYFVDSYPVTGWQYIDGYKYYFAEDGRLVTDVESLLPAGGPYMIKINKEMNCLTVYAKDGANGFIIPVKAFLTSVGDDTPLGTFRTPEKYRWRLMIHDLYTQYATRLGPGMPILIHSIIYDKPNPFTVWASTYNNLGIARSAGCIRLASIEAKWIYDNCAIGTTVQVYESPNPGPLERPTILYEIPFEQTWDPTDPNVTQEMINAETQRILAKFQS